MWLREIGWTHGLEQFKIDVESQLNMKETYQMMAGSHIEDTIDK